MDKQNQQSQQNAGQTPPPVPKPKSKMKKNLIIAGCIVAAVVLWFVAAHFFGPDTKYSMNKIADSLRRDSVALQKDFKPGAQDMELTEIDKQAEELRDLGDPLRFGEDSTRIFGNPETKRIADYNIKRCREQLDECLPIWRMKYAVALHKHYNADKVKTIVRATGDGHDTLELYSLRFLSADEVKDVIPSLSYSLHNLGFRKVIVAPTPKSEKEEFTID